MTRAPATTWVVVPVKGFDAAKSRLAARLMPAERRRLAVELFEHVASVAGSAPGVRGWLVATDSAEVARMAKEVGAAVALDGARGSLASHVDGALDELRRQGAEHALVLMGDLPELTRQDVEALVRALDESDTVVASDIAGRHTNALGFRLDAAFPTHFGHDESYRLHIEAAHEAGLSLRRVTTPGLAFDMDTPDDYAALIERRGVAFPPPEAAAAADAADLGEATARSAKREDGWGGGIP